jgi:hypothetical protein
MMPAGFAGGWEGEVMDENGESTGIFLRTELADGYGGDTVANTFTVGGDFYCQEEAVLLTGSSTEVTLNGTNVTNTVPSTESCDPYSQQTLEEQPGGSLLWTDAGLGWTAELEPSTQNPGADGLPYSIYSKTYKAQDGSGLRITAETTAAAGELALTYTDGTCRWEALLVSGGNPDADTSTAIVVGPGESTQSSCDPLPAYHVDAGASGSDDTDVTLTPLDGSEAFRAVARP